MFDPYPLNPARAFARAPAAERAELDLIRQYFVAYSRPQYALIIMGSTDQIQAENQYSLRADQKLAHTAKHQYLRRRQLMAPWTSYTSVNVPPQRPRPVRPRFSLTSDIISYRRCRRQYGYFGNDGYVPAQTLQVFYGTVIHQVLDRCHRHYSGCSKVFREDPYRQTQK